MKKSTAWTKTPEHFRSGVLGINYKSAQISQSLIHMPCEHSFGAAFM